MKSFVFIWAVICVLLTPMVTHAYIGPGLGAGTLAVIAGFIISIFLAVFGMLWYPLKRFMNRLKSKRPKTN